MLKEVSGALWCYTLKHHQHCGVVVAVKSSKRLAPFTGHGGISVHRHLKWAVPTRIISSYLILICLNILQNRTTYVLTCFLAMIIADQHFTAVEQQYGRKLENRISIISKLKTKTTNLFNQNHAAAKQTKQIKGFTIFQQVNYNFLVSWKDHVLVQAKWWSFLHPCSCTWDIHCKQYRKIIYY